MRLLSGWEVATCHLPRPPLPPPPPKKYCTLNYHIPSSDHALVRGQYLRRTFLKQTSVTALNNIKYLVFLLWTQKLSTVRWDLKISKGWVAKNLSIWSLSSPEMWPSLLNVWFMNFLDHRLVSKDRKQNKKWRGIKSQKYWWHFYTAEKTKTLLKLYILLTVHHVMILGEWPTWCTNSFLCVYFYL